MGNIVKIPENETSTEGFRKIRRNYIKKYGENDHAINMEIGEKLGLNKKELAILDGKRSRYNEQTMKSDCYEIKICAYCDQRVAPFGVEGIQKRLEDAKKRYANKPLSVWSNEEKANDLIRCALKIEEQVMKECTIVPEEINDETIQKTIEELKSYLI